MTEVLPVCPDCDTNQYMEFVGLGLIKTEYDIFICNNCHKLIVIYDDGRIEEYDAHEV